MTKDEFANKSKEQIIDLLQRATPEQLLTLLRSIHREEAS